jgi:hypothetical protein
MEVLDVKLEMRLELIEDEYLMQYIVLDYRNQRLWKEKQRVVWQNLDLYELPKENKQ